MATRKSPPPKPGESSASTTTATNALIPPPDPSSGPAIRESGSPPPALDSKGQIRVDDSASRVGSVPPSSTEVERHDARILKGIAGSPGVAVGPALVLGDLRASFVRRHVPSAQVQGELDRVKQAVHDAKQTLREVSMRSSVRRMRPISAMRTLSSADTTSSSFAIDC
jgi:hypothetical protein